MSKNKNSNRNPQSAEQRKPAEQTESAGQSREAAKEAAENSKPAEDSKPDEDSPLSVDEIEAPEGTPPELVKALLALHSDLRSIDAVGKTHVVFTTKSAFLKEERPDLGGTNA